MSLIPNAPIAAKPDAMKSLLLMGLPKIGKTEMLLKLPNSLHIDFQRGAEAFGGNTVNVLSALDLLTAEHQKSRDNGPPPTALDVIENLLAELTIRQQGPKAFDFIVLDPITEMQKVGLIKGKQLYIASSQFDSKVNVNDIRMDLGYGKGYMLLEAAMIGLLSKFETLAKECLIMIAHPKNSIIMKGDKDVMIDDIDLETKVKGYIVQNCPAIGVIKRRFENQNWISFKRGVDDLYYGARQPHLANQEFMLSEKKPDGTLITNWQQLFPNYKPKKVA